MCETNVFDIDYFGEQNGTRQAIEVGARNELHAPADSLGEGSFLILEVQHVRRAFGNVMAVKNVDFAIERGTTFGLLGPNGAGKTTTMRMILGIIAPDSGEVRWNGQRIDATVRRHFGYLPEERGLYGKMKVREQIVYFARLHGIAPDVGLARAKSWIKDLELEEYADRPCSELSKGNQQKVQVACAAVHEPDLLILDEPFSGLDPVNADILLHNLRKLEAAGTTLVMSSHQMWQLETLCDRFTIISDGETRASGTLAELRSTWPTRVVALEPATPASSAIIKAIPGAREIHSPDHALRVEIPAQTELSPLLRALVDAGPVTRFERLEPSLQEIYLRAIGAEDRNAA